MTTPNDLSDKALAVFAFAAYHQLSSGDTVTSIVSRDHENHHADSAAVTELVERDLVHEEGDWLHFTPAGQLMLSQIIDRLKGS